MKPNRLPGHTLPTEGRIVDEHGNRLAVGSATCSCGMPSPVLDSDTKRRRWFMAHKDNLRAGGNGVVKVRAGAR